VPSAIATKNIWAPSLQSNDPRTRLTTSREVRLAEGHGAHDRWWLSAQDTSRGRCVSLFSGGEQSGGCSGTVPLKADLHLLSGTGRRDGFVFGVTSPAVARVRVLAEGQDITVVTTAPDRSAITHGGLRNDFRYFVIALRRPLEGTRAPTALALDRAGRVLQRLPER
jgi:hypothetical protein